MTVEPELAPDEALRLNALRSLNLIETPLEERFERITRMAKRLFAADICAISLVEADRQYFKSIQGSNTCQTSRGISFCGHAILEDDVFIVEDARTDDRFKDNPLVTGDPKVVFYAGVQVRSPDGYKIGMLCINHSQPMEFTGDDKRQLRDLGAMVELEFQSAAANAVQADLIENATAERRNALIDPLTRLWNRRGILNLAAQTLAKTPSANSPTELVAIELDTQTLTNAPASDSPAALIAIDLDGFKQINDTLGHPAGDEVLRVASKRMLSSIRESDVIGRLGGDEFLCLINPCENPGIAPAIAERIRVSLSSQPISTNAGPAQISASIGVVNIPQHCTKSLDELIERADKAMYESKHAGRDRITVDDTPHRNAA